MRCTATTCALHCRMRKHGRGNTLAALLGRPASSSTTAQLHQLVGVDRQQQRMKEQYRCEVSEIAVCYESHIAGDRRPTQCSHGAHAECRKHEAGGRKTDSVGDRQVVHPVFLPVARNSAKCAGPRVDPLGRIAPPAGNSLALSGRLLLDSRVNCVGLERPSGAFIAAARGAISDACIPPGKSKNIAKIRRLFAPATGHLPSRCNGTRRNLERLASVARQNLMQVRRPCAPTTHQVGGRP
jgi:hypothetical protein